MIPSLPQPPSTHSRARAPRRALTCRYVLYTELTVFENLVYSACMRASADEDAETR